MKLLIIRHGDPDYSIDSLTPQGRIEAELLSRKMEKTEVTDFYVSPLGRARDTAEYTLKKLGRTAKVCDWLREFPACIDKPNKSGSCAWDWLPLDWMGNDAFYSAEDWMNEPVMQAGGVPELYRIVTTELDRLLEKHGYVREGRLYRAVRPNEDTIAFFCHFGLECVLLSHLLNVSPMPLWHGTCAAPTSVTTVVTEERRQGIASFRMSCFGDTSHLYVAGVEPSFAARFCEIYDSDQRHD